MSRLPLCLALALAAMLWAGCRTTLPNTPPAVPPEATTLILTDDEMPRVLYASAWGAFAEAGWDVTEYDSDVLRFVARRGGMDGEAEVNIESNAPRGIAEQGRIVVSVDPADSDAHAVLLAAARALATVPGRLSFR
ncbi:MAG: hypothetical protein ABJF88_10700 [Rhodothermales bacterium]